MDNGPMRAARARQELFARPEGGGGARGMRPSMLMEYSGGSAEEARLAAEEEAQREAAVASLVNSISTLSDLQRLVIQEAAVQGEAINTIEDMIAETSSAADAALRDYQAGMHSDAGKYNTRMTGMGAVSGGFLGGISLSWLGAGIGGGIGAKIGNFFGSSVTNAIRDNVDTEVENYDKRRAARRNKDGTAEGECDDAADDGTARGRANGLRDDAATAASAGPMGAWLEVHGSDPLPPPSRTGETASRGWGKGDDNGRQDGSVRDQLFASSRLSGAEGRSNDRQPARWGSNATAATPPSRADESLTNGRPRPRRWGEVATAENDLDAAAALVRAQEERRLLGLDILDDPRVLHALEEAGMTLADANQLLAEQGEQILGTIPELNDAHDALHTVERVHNHTSIFGVIKNFFKKRAPDDTVGERGDQVPTEGGDGSDLDDSSDTGVVLTEAERRLAAIRAGARAQNRELERHSRNLDLISDKEDAIQAQLVRVNKKADYKLGR